MQAYHDLFNDSWKFFKHYASQIPLTENQWDELITMMPKFVRRHPEHEEFARKMILMLEAEIERADKENRRENK